MLYGGGRGGGKTDGILGKAIQHAHTYGADARILLARRSYPQLGEAEKRCWELLPATGARWRASDREWRWASGAFMRLRHLETEADAAEYQGHSYTLILVDEAGDFPSPVPIDTLRATMRSAAGVPTQMVCTANPGGKGHAWLRSRYVKGRPPMAPWFDTEARIFRVYIPSRLTDNPALALADPRYVDKLRAATVGRPWLLTAWLTGDWDASLEGDIIHRDWLTAAPRYEHRLAEYRRIFQSWDTAQKVGQLNDPSVCMTFGEDDKGDAWILDVFRQRLAYPDLERMAQSLAERDNPGAVLIEDKSSGTSLIQTCRASLAWRWSVIPIEPTADKVTRMAVQTPWFQARRVWLPKSAPWLPDLETEILGFPGATYDDQVDALSQGLAWLADPAGNVDALNTW